MPAKTKYDLPLGAATREAFGKALVELGRTNPNVVALDADLSKSTYTAGFAKEFPDHVVPVFVNKRGFPDHSDPAVMADYREAEIARQQGDIAGLINASVSACRRAFDNVGINSATSTAITPITTSNSTRVNPASFTSFTWVAVG